MSCLIYRLFSFSSLPSSFDTFSMLSNTEQNITTLVHYYPVNPYPAGTENDYPLQPV